MCSVCVCVTCVINNFFSLLLPWLCCVCGNMCLHDVPLLSIFYFFFLSSHICSGSIHAGDSDRRVYVWSREKKIIWHNQNESKRCVYVFFFFHFIRPNGFFGDTRQRGKMMILYDIISIWNAWRLTPTLSIYLAYYYSVTIYSRECSTIRAIPYIYISIYRYEHILVGISTLYAYIVQQSAWILCFCYVSMLFLR